jgi:hypothetical protein
MAQDRLESVLDSLVGFREDLPTRPLDGAGLRWELAEMRDVFFARTAPDGTILLSEGGALRRMGLEPGQVVGRNISEWPSSTIAAAIWKCLGEGSFVAVIESPLFGGQWLGSFTRVTNGQSYCNLVLVALPEGLGVPCQAGCPLEPERF